MERGFNDDELADIMNEIESLEQEFADESSATHPAAMQESEATDAQQEDSMMTDDTTDEEAQAFAAEVDAQMEDVVEELSEMPVENVVQMNRREQAADREVHHARQVRHSQTTSRSETSMNFSVSGEMTVNLSFQVGDEVVSLSVNEGQGLVIEMNNGMTLTLPISNTSSVRKAS